MTQPSKYVLTLIFLLNLVIHAPVALAQSANSDFQLSGATIVAKDVKLSATWYRKYLDIAIKEYKPQQHVKMRTGEFDLLIRQGKNILLRNQIKFPKGKKYVNGINKIGFSTNQFEEVRERLLASGQKLIEDVTEDKNLNMQYILTSDPDGNTVQIFNDPIPSDSIMTRAMFFSITSSDYINTMRWYEENFDFTEVKIVDESKIHFQNLLQKGNVIFEIIHLPYESLETTEFMPLDRELASFEELKFKSGTGKATNFEMDNNANKVQWLH
ncbi:VOC family protein [Reichenbachiella carrageenanivorans]|uniref:VOC family protein n=1 Tax=Reichenbachiella carrageenanivorans TaxID=2979869 RepID=A0ABY6D4N9_9BACT|nr:VOC family protein [Reichenbachiella carrageenanivorans]UXX81122.1 VOC family protein [Reichenbachiella carrageenanivorans]